MRDYQDHVKTTLTLKDNTLRVILTEANHALVEAVDGWLYRGARVYYSIHVIFDGKAWVRQSFSGAVHCPETSDKGEKIVTQAVLDGLNAAVTGDNRLLTDWFNKLRQEAEAHNTNNDLMRVEKEMAELEARLAALRLKAETLQRREAAALQGNVPAAYTEPTR